MKKKIITAVVCIVVVIGLVSVGYWARGYYDSQQKSNAQKTASTFVQDLVAGNNKAAYGLTDSALQKAQTEAKFTTNMGDLKSANATYDKAVVLVDGSKIVYTQHVQNLPKTADGQTDGTFYLRLSKQDSSWKITSATVN